MNVTEIREASVALCPTCKGALLPTPSGKFSCLKMCGPLKGLDDERSQRRALAISGECRGEDVNVAIDKQWVAFVRSLPVARKVKVGKRTAWEMGGANYKRGRRIKFLAEIGANDVCAVLTPRTNMRVSTLLPFDAPAKAATKKIIITAASNPFAETYTKAKEAAPGAILLFRTGDFYEAFYDDAKTVSAALGLTLTTQTKGDSSVPMTGFPHQRLEGFLKSLVAAKHRVAVCEQARSDDAS